MNSLFKFVRWLLIRAVDKLIRRAEFEFKRLALLGRETLLLVE